MPIVGGGVEAVIVAAALLVAVSLWMVRRRRVYPGPRLLGDDIDRDALEAAEREVRNLDPLQRPEDGFEGDDWGPGAVGPRPPVRL
ncbi:MAG: hypothetical protein H0W67_08590 [Gemmatimonadales bacterium]|nr:hypothetical protein [Gemmatimonadales bacterium]